MSFSTTYNRSGRSNCFHPLPLGDLVGGLVGTARAAWPVWRDSTRKEVKFHPLPKKKAARLYHEARRFERRTRTKGKQDGALGRNGLKVLETLIFDFLNYFTGRLDPSQEAIANKAGISLRSVARGLEKLQAAGILHKVRRCAEDWINGRFVLRQQTNAYGIIPATQWRGYTPEPEAPAPTGDTWGATPPLPTCLENAAQEAPQGILAQVRELEADPRDGLAAVLARLGRCVAAKA